MTDTESSALSVYITGATTGLGREVMRQLVAQGHKVAGTVTSLTEANLVREAGGLPVYNDLYRAREVASILRLVKADVVVDNAPQSLNTLVMDKRPWGEYPALLREGAAALAEGAALTGAKFIVQTSFAFLYGDTHGELADEHHDLSTDDPLFDAAASAEETILGGSVPGCVLRAGFNYGPDNPSLQALRLALIGRGVVNVGSGAASWVHTADLASAIVKAVGQQPGGQVFNVADDSPMSQAAFVDHFADSLGVRHPGRLNLPFNLREVALHPSHRALLDVNFKASTAKAKDQLGWVAAYSTVDSGIAQILLAWRATEAV